MNISVRQADLESERRELIDLLQTNLPQLPHAQYFDWLYRNNPEGLALTWVATEEDSGKLVGMAAAFPRRAFCFGKEVRGYVLGDFCIAAEHRSLGLALRLQRACIAALSDADARFALDFPSEGMLAVYRRLRIDPDKTMTRYAKLLRADRKLVERVAVGPVARGLAIMANGVLSLRDTRKQRRTPWRIGADAGPWGEEFTQAALEWSFCSGTYAARTAEFLNWRYRLHPQWRYEMLTARGRGKLQGYLVQHVSGVDCTIDELMAGDDAVRQDLLAESIAVVRARSVQTLSVPWLSSHPGKELLLRCGFRPRESRPVVLLSWPPAAKPAGDNEGWYLSQGDWEH